MNDLDLSGELRHSRTPYEEVTWSFTLCGSMTTVTVGCSSAFYSHACCIYVKSYHVCRSASCESKSLLSSSCSEGSARPVSYLSYHAMQVSSMVFQPLDPGDHCSRGNYTTPTLKRGFRSTLSPYPWPSPSGLRTFETCKQRCTKS